MFRTRSQHLLWIGGLLLALPFAVGAQPKLQPASAVRADAAHQAQASQPTSAASAAPDQRPFPQLPIVVPKDRLPPLRSVRIRDQREEDERSRKSEISISISAQPKGVAIYYGGKLLGTTPLTLQAKRGSTPFDVVLRAGGYMTLHTRIHRRVSRSYFFKLTPAKLR